MLIPPSFTSCPPCGSEFLLRGGDKNQSKTLPQGEQEVKEGKSGSDERNPRPLAFVGPALCLVSSPELYDVARTGLGE